MFHAAYFVSGCCVKSCASSGVDLDCRYMGIENLKTLYLLCKGRLGGDPI